MRLQSLARAIARAIPIATVALATGAGAASTWPRSLSLERANLVVYQPQIEEIEGVTLTGRMAVSWEPTGGSPTFGVVWFEARFLADKDSGEVQIEQYTVRKVRFPESTPEQEKKLAAYLEEEFPKWDLRPSLSDLQNAVAASKKVGALIGKICKSKQIDKVVFDRNGYAYHGRVSALAQAAREAGLEF